MSEVNKPVEKVFDEKAWKAEWYLKNKERLSLAAKENYLKNREIRLEKARKYAEENSEKIKESSRKRYIDNKEEFAKKSKSYREKNKEKIALAKKLDKESKLSIYKEKAKDYYAENKDRIILKSKKWVEDNPEKVKERAAAYYDTNSEEIKLRTSKYAKDNREKVNAYHRKRNAERRANDPTFKIMSSLRCRVKSALKHNRKSASTLELLGCSAEFARTHVESKFQEGMSWDNHGEWHIDHIQPFASFDLSCPEQQRQACHYTNLQPLWAIDNLSKGDKLPCGNRARNLKYP